MTTTKDDDLDTLRARQAEIGACLAVVASHGGGDTRELEEELTAIERALQERGAAQKS